ncbi:ABC transporter ATP-binding protein [Methylogaea oryzae]|uniref:ABC transporter ATP-binding protein n=1 Tax=Methylogaea oryzae TaxID=1295382 RepID=A0A8D4VQM6_9GAMM|nr:ABC transporter ATP-binding protein [Methylogaea oryzae]BBL72273.1 ABC transporter ATP-binding protein [Methylogaea oryzae]
MTQVDIHIQRKAYKPGAPAAIEDLHLSLAPGEFVCLVGPSGCGKTTLLNLVAGLDRDYQGAIDIGHRQGAAPVIGYVFQNPRLLPWRTVRENIDLALPGDGGADVDELLRILGLEAAQHVYPQRLSLGMSRRAAIARAFAVEPDLLLMDEPFVSLDPPTARRVRQLLLEVWGVRPHTVLFVTHDLREAISLADRLIFLTPSPTRVVAEVAVDIPRAARDQEKAVEAFRQRLTTERPEIGHLL